MSQLTDWSLESVEVLPNHDHTLVQADVINADDCIAVYAMDDQGRSVLFRMTSKQAASLAATLEGFVDQRMEEGWN